MVEAHISVMSQVGNIKHHSDYLQFHNLSLTFFTIIMRAFNGGLRRSDSRTSMASGKKRDQNL